MTTSVQTSSCNYLAPGQKAINLQWPERYVSIISGVKIGFSGIKSLFSKPVSAIIKIGAGGYLLNRGISGHCELYEMVGRHDKRPVEVRIRTSVKVNRSRDEVYRFWRNLENLPLFMTHLKSVDMLNEVESRWALKLPANMADVSWEAEIVYDEPGNVIVWQSLPDAIIHNSGKVRFIDTPDDGCTLIHVTIAYQPPAGILGAGIAQVINPMFKKMVEDDIQNFKKYMDIGEIAEEIAVITISEQPD